MLDIPTAWSPAAGYGDWQIAAAAPELITDEQGRPIVDETGAALTDGFLVGLGGLVVGNDLGTAILISLFTDRTADSDDIMPDGSADPRGWWGDLGADVPIGSKLWLRGRAKQTALTLALVKDDIETALGWLIADGVANDVQVTTEWTRPGMLGAQVIVFGRGGASARFSWAWEVR